MKRNIQIILFSCLVYSAVTVFGQEKTEPEKPECKQQEEKRDTQEIDMIDIFGDPDVLNNGESIRSITEPMPAWKLYCMSWGAWVAVRCEATLVYLKKVQVAMKKRICALIGLCYVQQKQQQQK